MRQTKEQVKTKFKDARIVDPRGALTPQQLQMRLQQRARKVPDKAKESSRRACRGKVTTE